MTAREGHAPSCPSECRGIAQTSLDRKPKNRRSQCASTKLEIWKIPLRIGLEPGTTKRAPPGCSVFYPVRIRAICGQNWFESSEFDPYNRRVHGMHRIHTFDPQTGLTTDFTDEDRIQHPRSAVRDQRSMGGARFVVTSEK